MDEDAALPRADPELVRLVRRLGNKGQGGAKRPIPKPVLSEVRRLAEAGHFHAEIMRQLGVSRNTIRRALNGQ